jgi:hypothetical protein
VRPCFVHAAAEEDLFRLELCLIDNDVVSSESEKPGNLVMQHPAQALAYSKQDPALEQSMTLAYGLAVETTREFPKVAFWRFVDRDDEPLTARPIGSSAGGAAFYGFAKLLKRDKLEDGWVVIAKVAGGDLTSFSDKTELDALKAKARSIAKQEMITRVIVADEDNAKILHEALSKHGSAHAKTIEVHYPR